MSNLQSNISCDRYKIYLVHTDDTTHDISGYSYTPNTTVLTDLQYLLIASLLNILGLKRNKIHLK